MKIRLLRGKSFVFKWKEETPNIMEDLNSESRMEKRRRVKRHVSDYVCVKRTPSQALMISDTNESRTWRPKLKGENNFLPDNRETANSLSKQRSDFVSCASFLITIKKKLTTITVNKKKKTPKIMQEENSYARTKDKIR